MLKAGGLSGLLKSIKLVQCTITAKHFHTVCFFLNKIIIRLPATKIKPIVKCMIEGITQDIGNVLTGSAPS